MAAIMRRACVRRLDVHVRSVLNINRCVFIAEGAVLFKVRHRTGFAVANPGQPRKLSGLKAQFDSGGPTFAALRAAWSLLSSSCKSEVLRIVPPVPFTSSSTLSGVDLLTRTNSAELFGVKVGARSSMN